MRNLEKFIVSMLLTCFLIFLVFSRTYCMSGLLRQELNYKDNRDKDMPKEANVEIDGSEIISTVKLPDIELSFEKVLYGHQDLIDIDFFSNNNENNNKFWMSVRNIVRLVYRSTLYVSFAIMLLFIIYEGVKLAVDSFRGNSNNAEITVPGLSEKSVKFRIKDKIFVQEWIIGIISLVLLTLGINIMIQFSDYIIRESYIGAEGTDGIDNQKISVIVKGGNFPVGEISLTGDVTELSNFKSYMFIGDSRVRQMSHLYTETDDIFISEYGADVEWLENTGIPKAEKKLTKGMNVIIWMGTNDYWNQKLYIKLINSKVSSWGAKGVNITVGTIRTKSI